MSPPGEEAAATPANAAVRPPEAPPRRIGFGDLISLFTRPRQFFSGKLAIGDMIYLVPVIWINGIASQLDRIDTEILRAQLDLTRPTWRVIEPLVTGSWLAFWAFSVGLGIVSGAIMYLIGGWWYGLRARWSDARNFNKSRARHVYMWSNMIVSIPYIVLTVTYTFRFPNYLAAYNSEELIGLLFVAAMFWSVGVSYIGVNATFEMTHWKARIWFLVLPVMFYLFALGLIVALFSLLG